MLLCGSMGKGHPVVNGEDHSRKYDVFVAVVWTMSWKWTKSKEPKMLQNFVQRTLCTQSYQKKKKKIEQYHQIRIDNI